jgi:putative membrane protein
MSPMQESKPSGSQSEPDPRVFFAAERTFLEWIRTGLALMGFGFVAARFGLFFHEVEATLQGCLDNLRPAFSACVAC